ncbi:MAG TPA: FAD-binding oxidoreductase [Hyphomicrobiales bacterium]|nr:FAD-binding oxidoreductase [Hyphomicrobiales bacterium]
MIATTLPDSATLDRIAEIVGERYALREDADMRPYLVEPREKYFGKAAMVLRPGSVEDVSRILALANETRTPIVPQCGNTGLVGAQIPFERGDEIVLSLGRLNRILKVDPEGDAMTIEAGCTLAAIQEAADDADRLFPLSMGSEGTCQIGGNIATNAGGVAVLAYGPTRDQVLGLQAVLADGRVWDGLRALRKDNTGYDLKQLFIGSEGTLGVITAAVLQLHPKPRARETAFVGLASPEAAIRLLNRAQGRFGRGVTSFELMSRLGLDFVLRHLPGSRDPLEDSWPWYVLLEISSGDKAETVRPHLETMLADALEAGEAGNAMLAASAAQAEMLWRMRAGLSEVQKQEGGSIKHDVSVPIAAIPGFMDEAAKRVEEIVPGARLVPFGHLGDGNIHYNISQPVGADRDAFLARWEEVSASVHDLVTRLGGSISAEHGIGRMKKDLLPGVKSPIEMEMMRAIKHTFDPNGILNPGKLL